MAGAERVGGGGSSQVNGLTRAEESARNVPARRNSRAAFDERVGPESNASGAEHASEYLTAEKWLRERTVEELKTLVEAIQGGVTDPWQLTDLIFYARHPEMKGQPLTDQSLLDEWNQISALLVHPAVDRESVDCQCGGAGRGRESSARALLGLHAHGSPARAGGDG
jgi:hypothetical protein